MPMNIITLMYVSATVVSFLGYFPQIIRLIKRHTDCRDISLASWWIWNYTTTASLLYGVFILHDTLFVIACTSNLIGINAIIGLVLYKRWRYSQTNAL